MNSKNEDFPTPVSPTRRIVYGACASFFDVLMKPFLRDSTSLEKYWVNSRTQYGMETYLIVEVLPSSSSSKTFSRGSAEL